jgi:hypothetical protein
MTPKHHPECLMRLEANSPVDDRTISRTVLMANDGNEVRFAKQEKKPRESASLTSVLLAFPAIN